MTNEQLELSEAVKYFNGELREKQVTEIHQKPLVILAQRYLLASSAMPEKKISCGELCVCCEGNNAFNQAIDLCTLASVKREMILWKEFQDRLKKKLEGIHEVINKVFDDVEAPSQKVYTEDISIALKTFLTTDALKRWEDFNK